MNFNSVENAIADIRKGRMIIVADDEDRENEGDLVIASTMVRPEDINPDNTVRSDRVASAQVKYSGRGALGSKGHVNSSFAV